MNMDAQEIMKKLQEPFPPEEIEWRVDRGQKTASGNFVFVLAYVTNRAIQNRLDEVFGPFGWKNEYREWKGTSQLCGISVHFNGEWITKWDGSDDSNMDAVKGGLSGAMKRTAVQWGIGRYLYNLEQNRVPIMERGENYTSVKVKASGKEEYITGYWNTPKLPDWALPEAFKGKGTGARAVTTEPEPATDIPPQTLKVKYQLFFGSMDGFENWAQEQQTAGKNYRTMEHGLQDELMKREGGGSGRKINLNAKSRVINLMNEMKWSWTDLGSFASDCLGRPIKKVISDIKLEDEWKKVEEAMLVTKNAVS